jgi:curved DNA-binding protein
MQNFRNYYEILEIPREATSEQVKQAYRKLARQYHPDLNPGDKVAEEHFKRLGEAYEVLSDPDKRTQYEAFSRFWNRQGFSELWQGRRSQQAANSADFSEWDDFNRFVDQLLNRHKAEAAGGSATEAVPRRRKSSQSKATVKARANRRDVAADLVVPLERAYLGGLERIRLEDGRSLEVSMPGGMVSGQRIRLRGQGIGGGDLYLKIMVEPHPCFQLQGADIVCRLPLTPSEATLGGTMTVPTLDGPVQMTIPAGVQPGQKLRLAGKGYPLNLEGRGDQIVEIAIAIPTVLDPEEKNLYQALRSIERFNPRADLPS